MPESKSRHTHQQHPQHHAAPNPTKSKKISRVVKIAIVFFALLGLGIGYFIDGDSLISLAAGGLGGAVAGYLFGHQIDKALKKK